MGETNTQPVQTEKGHSLRIWLGAESQTDAEMPEIQIKRKGEGDPTVRSDEPDLDLRAPVDFYQRHPVFLWPDSLRPDPISFWPLGPFRGTPPRPGGEGPNVGSIFHIILALFSEGVVSQEDRMPYFPYDGDDRKRHDCEVFLSNCAATIPLIWWRFPPDPSR